MEIPESLVMTDRRPFPAIHAADVIHVSCARYYQYFAAGVEICTPSFTKYQET